MSKPNGFHVRFLLATNLPVSVTRITADTANYLVRNGIPATVMFPSVDWWEYRRFMLGRLAPLPRLKEALKLAAESARAALFPKPWCGFSDFHVDPRVRVSRFGAIPPLSSLEGGITVAPHTYVVARRLLESRPRRMPKLVGALHVNLEKAACSASPEGSAWFRHWVELERGLKIPRYATSRDSQQAAERLGIPVQRMIPGGIDLNLFKVKQRPAGERLTVSLYCDPNKHKGMETGVEAMAGLRARAPEIRLCSIGQVAGEQKNLFDVNHGYLRGQDYIAALQETDVFVYPSLFDGFPAPPLQAMACGAALVTTAVEGVVEYAKEEENCLLCPPGDPAALRDQTLRLLREEPLRRRVRAGGLETAGEFSTERSSAKLLDFLREIYAQEAA